MKTTVYQCSLGDDRHNGILIFTEGYPGSGQTKIVRGLMALHSCGGLMKFRNMLSASNPAYVLVCRKCFLRLTVPRNVETVCEFYESLR